MYGGLGHMNNRLSLLKHAEGSHCELSQEPKRSLLFFL